MKVGTRPDGIPHDNGSNPPKLTDSRSARFARVPLRVPKNKLAPQSPNPRNINGAALNRLSLPFYLS